MNVVIAFCHSEKARRTGRIKERDISVGAFAHMAKRRTGYEAEK
jgi:hypothetical protein